MKTTRRSPWLVLVLGILSLLVLPAVAMAGPRSGSSFGGRLGFRSPSGSTMPPAYSGGGGGRGHGRRPALLLPARRGRGGGARVAGGPGAVADPERGGGGW